MRKILVAMVLLTIAFISVGIVVAEPPEPPLMDVQIKIWTNQSHTLIYINGIPLNDRIDELQNQYNVLSNHIRQTDANVYDYIILNEMRTRLMSMHQYAIQVLQRELLTNTSLTTEQKDIILNDIVRHNSEIMNIQSDVDNILINILMRYQNILNQNEEFSYSGYHDIYGDFHYFKETTDQYLREEVFRITDCYSETGQSKVLQGGWVIVKGINSYGSGVFTTRGMWITYIDPASGVTKEFYVGKGTDMETSEFRIKWYRNVFEFSIKIDSDTPEGMKQITFKRESPRGGVEYIRVSFDVIRPYIDVYTSLSDDKIGLSVNTNLNKIKVSYGDVVKELSTEYGRVFTVLDRSDSDIIYVTGVGDYSFVNVLEPVI